MKRELVAICVVLFSLGCAAYFYPQLTPNMSLGIPKSIGLVLQPILAVFLATTHIFVIKKLPRLPRRKLYGVFLLIAEIFLLYVQILFIWHSMGGHFIFAQFFVPALGVVVMVVGYEKLHTAGNISKSKIEGWMVVACGAILFLTLLVPHMAWNIGIIVLAVLIVALRLYHIWKKSVFSLQ